MVIGDQVIGNQVARRQLIKHLIFASAGHLASEPLTA